MTWVPEAGEERLPEEEIESAAADYLQTELAERIADAPVRFSLVATIAGEDDPLEDPTLPWPDDRERVELGTLELTERLPDEKPGDAHVFDPMNLVDGIEPSEDKVLHARTHAYSVSIERRLAAGRQLAEGEGVAGRPPGRTRGSARGRPPSAGRPGGRGAARRCGRWRR